MIEIKFEAATGAEARKEMLDFLGINANVTIGNGINTFSDLQPITAEAKKVEMQIVDSSATTEETPKPEKTTRTRRSKAEIEAEAALAANTGSEEPPASTKSAAEDFNSLMDKIETEKTETTITAEDLTKKCVEMGRNGKRDAVLAVFESQFGGATISKKDGKPQLTAEQYPAVMEALNALA